MRFEELDKTERARAAGLDASAGAPPSTSFDYDYDDAGNRTGAQALLAAFTDIDTDYGYDRSNRLITIGQAGIWENSNAFTFYYDYPGRRFRMSGGE